LVGAELLVRRPGCGRLRAQGGREERNAGYDEKGEAVKLHLRTLCRDWRAASVHFLAAIRVWSRPADALGLRR